MSRNATNQPILHGVLYFSPDERSSAITTAIKSATVRENVETTPQQTYNNSPRGMRTRAYFFLSDILIKRGR